MKPTAQGINLILHVLAAFVWLHSMSQPTHLAPPNQYQPWPCACVCLQEDEILRRAVALHEGKNWKTIGES